MPCFSTVCTLDRQILRIVRVDPVCRLLMTAPGVGALVSLAFKVAVDDPRRFSRSRDVGAHFGLTPREYSSGEASYHGRISKMGDPEVRRLLYVAASRMLRRDGAVVSAQSLGRAPRAARRDPQGAGGAGAQTRGRAARHVERRPGVPVAAFGGIGINRAGIAPTFSELPPSPRWRRR
jgi:hypothetical protein